MISDPKSARFINWTEHGTRYELIGKFSIVVLFVSFHALFRSFVVSNVGEFSRTILGAHFKHNNVRRLNGDLRGPVADAVHSSRLSCVN